MLSITVRTRERVVLKLPSGEIIEVAVNHLRDNRVEMGFEAPRNVEILGPHRHTLGLVPYGKSRRGTPGGAR